MNRPLPPNFKTIGDLSRAVVARAKHNHLAHEIAAVLVNYGVDLTDEARCWQILIVDRAVKATYDEIDACFDDAVALAKARKQPEAVNASA